jgi:rhodanese-related sulfurtransferase
MKILISIFMLISDADVPRITVEEAKKGFDNGSVVFVDARAADAYTAEHIKGAVIIKGAGEDRFDSLPKGKKIIVYCS